MNGNLYIVPTPIGNLGDITFRAIEVLKSVALIAAEDTRRTSILLNHYKINTPMISFHEHNQSKKTAEIIEQLQEGKDVALVSDAGTPLIADPGSLLISRAIEENIQIIPLPGASALLTALIASGHSLQEFIFLGFLPKKKSLIKERFEQVKDSAMTIVFYESPNRLRATLEFLLEILGDKRVVICREMTKLHEEIIRSNISGAIAGLPEKVRGEITVVLEGGTPEEVSIEDIKPRVVALLKEGISVSRVADLLRKETGISRKTIYTMALALALALQISKKD